MEIIFQALFDYEVDSDDEWEEEDPGESVSSDEVGITPVIRNGIWLHQAIIYWNTLRTQHLI